MKSHTMSFYQRQDDFNYKLSVHYDLRAKVFDVCLITQKEPKKWRHCFKKRNELYYYIVFEKHFDYNQVFLEKQLLDCTKTMCQRRSEEGTYEVIYLEDILEEMKHLNTLIYTGAGISTKSGICDLEGLLMSLLIHDYATLVNVIMTDIGKIKKAYIEFLLDLYFSKPNIVHKAIDLIQKQYHCMLLTENRDTLHQQCGSTVFERDQIDQLNLQEIEMVVVIGMDKDHQGLIERLRKMQVKICVINRVETSYLQCSDAFLKGDVYELMKNYLENKNDDEI